jgi:hypothetical protein
MPSPYLDDDAVPLYNHEGGVSATSMSDTGFILDDGTPVASLHDEEQFDAFNGPYLGWFQDGWSGSPRAFSVLVVRSQWRPQADRRDMQDPHVRGDLQNLRAVRNSNGPRNLLEPPVGRW